MCHFTIMAATINLLPIHSALCSIFSRGIRTAQEGNCLANYRNNPALALQVERDEAGSQMRAAAGDADALKTIPGVA
jgi:hypothetical protein